MARKGDKAQFSNLPNKEGDGILLKPISAEQKQGKNVGGELGKVCNYCGGLGWTKVITGGQKNCNDCQGTGVVKPAVDEQLAAMQKQIDEMKSWIQGMVKQMISEGIIKNIPTNIEEIIKNNE